MQSRLIVFSGNSNPVLAQKVCSSLGVSLGNALVGRFCDGEVRLEVRQNVRGMDVYIIQSTCPPINDNLVELLVMIDALKRASARRINAVIPYYGYGRKDKKDKPRVAIASKLVADLLAVAGCDRVITIDLHADQIQGFFSIPVEHLWGIGVLLDEVRKDKKANEVILAPDAGGVERARAFAKQLKLDLAIMDHRRTENEEPYSRIVGNVQGRRVLILDDLVDTGRTLERAARSAQAAGASSVDACCVHAVLSGSAVQRLDASPLRSLTVSDTVPLSEACEGWSKIRVVSIAPMLSEVIRRVHFEESVSSLFVSS